jgi:hypothetical protein
MSRECRSADHERHDNDDGMFVLYLYYGEVVVLSFCSGPDIANPTEARLQNWPCADWLV